jgi:hypothetical protein
MDDAQRRSLQAAKLGALVRAQAPGFAGVAADFAGGAALVDADGGAAWMLVAAQPAFVALGPVLVWAERHGARRVDLVSDLPSTTRPSDSRALEEAILARRAELFDPVPAIWTVAGTELVDVAPAAVPVPRSAPPAPVLAELLVDAGLEIVIEDGIVRGEVLGLEVARIVHGTTTAGMPIDEPVLEVGVGHADREMTAVLHQNMPSAAQLERVKEIVLATRTISAERHPLNQLAPERWMRSTLVRDPARIGLQSLRSVEGAVPRPNLRDRSVAYGIGTRADGAQVVVACSVGIDPDLVPAAADTRRMHLPDAPLLLVVPERDAHPVTRALAERLTQPAEVVTLAGDWRV